MKAGEVFFCVCCESNANVAEASFDRALEGPVCEPCRKNLRAADAWLKAAGIKTVTQDHNER